MAGNTLDTGHPPLLEAAMAILQASPGQALNITLLNKALFYLDLVALRDLGRTVTGAEYVALERGPVVDGYREMVGALEKAGLAVQMNEGENARPVAVQQALGAFRHLPPEVLRTARRIGEQFGRMSSAAASDASHRNPGWRAAWAKAEEKKIRVYPIDMLLALQGLGDDDPWLEAPADDELVAALRDASTDPGEPW